MEACAFILGIHSGDLVNGKRGRGRSSRKCEAGELLSLTLIGSLNRLRFNYLDDVKFNTVDEFTL